MVDDLEHAYDASKRREYYLRTRKLKGRKPGAKKVVKPKLTRAQRQAARRKKLEAQVNSLKRKLEILRDALKLATEQAQARSGMKPNKTESKKSTSTQKKTESKKLTSAEKAKAAKASAEYREKNPDKALEEEVKSLNAKIKTIQERIAKMRKTGSVGAQKTTK